MKCPACDRPGVEALVDVTVVIPAGVRTIDKPVLASSAVRIERVDWPRQRYRCPACGWRAVSAEA